MFFNTGYVVFDINSKEYYCGYGYEGKPFFGNKREISALICMIYIFEDEDSIYQRFVEDAGKWGDSVFEGRLLEVRKVLSPEGLK
jgi:hypothetical protein